MLVELGRVSDLPRTLAPQLSIPSAYRSCSLDTPPDGTIPKATCQASSDPILPSSKILDLAARASAAVHARVDPEALHTAALIDLVWGGAAGASLERSISYLQTASRLSDRPGPVLADLAAAYLVRAEANQTPRDLLEAIEAAEQALEREPRNGAARFNLALALDRLGLEGQMTEAWREFLAVDSTSRWADEARLRLRAAVPVRPPPVPPANASAAELAAYAARSPQEAQFLGWDRLLEAWGSATLQGNTQQAGRLLAQAAALGNTLEQRGGDATVAAAVRAINAAASNPRQVRTLAQAHKHYAGGRSAYIAGQYDVAGKSFDAVLALRPASSPLQRWAQMHHGATLVYAGQMELAKRMFEELIADSDASRHASFAGRVRWALGTTLLRQGRYEGALTRYNEAAGLFERAGEREHLGGIQYLIGETQFLLGDASTAYESTHKALSTLRPYQGSVWLNNVLKVASDNAMDDGLQRAALLIQKENILVAARTDRPIYLAEAYLARARLLASINSSPFEDLRAGRAIVEQLEPGGARRWFEADLRLSEARALMRTDPAQAAAALDSVIPFFAPLNAERLLWGLTGRASARLALGDVDGTKSDLDRAVMLVTEQRDSVTRASLQAALMEQAREVFDRVVMLHVGARDPVMALAYLERGRASLAPTRLDPTPNINAGLRSRPGEVVLNYALIGDTLLAWTVVNHTIQLTQVTVNRSRLLDTIERVRSALELRAEEAAVRPQLTALYDLLIRPLQAHLSPTGMPLVVVADGEIAGVPFSALYDKSREQYLVEAHSMRFANSMRDAAHNDVRNQVRDPTILLVADPAFNEREHPDLARLPEAVAETSAIAAGYRRTAMLSGADAKSGALQKALEEADILHFAGHAIFDSARPERSFLLLAAGPNRREADRLRAAEAQMLDLRHVRLAVLSACQTVGVRGGRATGFAGFAGALLSAGVDGVVGSLWRVDDRLTRALMTDFHTAYQSSGNGAVALRTAQLALLRSGDPDLQSPAAWAGFRYTGA
jgi:CHAT domain-containing protein